MHRDSVESSNVATIGYEDGVLEVEFKNGGVYQYPDVTQEEFDSPVKADSVGRWLNQVIKPNHEGIKQ